jgi:hypothetical protein
MSPQILPTCVEYAKPQLSFASWAARRVSRTT